jgi:transglutaminase-like putative cysteine protease
MLEGSTSACPDIDQCGQFRGSNHSAREVTASMARMSRTFAWLPLMLLACAGAVLAAGPPQAAQQSAQAPANHSAPEDYTLLTVPVAKVVATLTREADYPKIAATEWTIFASRAPELPGQTQIETTLEPAGDPVLEKEGLGRTLLMGRVHGTLQNPVNSQRMQLTYHATLRSRKLRKGGASRKVADLSLEEREMYLAAGGFYDFDQPEFREWVGQHGLERKANEGDIRFARRVFLALKSGLQYEWGSNLDFHATAACKTAKGDCGAMSVLFGSIMRSNGVPARTLWGRWAKSSVPGKLWYNKPYYQTHVKAEFFARGVGWVPVDVSSAVLHDKSPQGLKFFGNDPGDFIAFHVDGKIDFDTRLFGVKTVNGLQNLHWWVKGRGKLDDGKLTEMWEVKRTRLN